MSEPILSGVLVSVIFPDAEIILSHKGESKPNTKTIVKGVPVTLNGKTCRLVDLRAGDLVNVRGEPPMRLDATR